jgi:hypothetical protein
MCRMTLRCWAIAASLFAGACGGPAPVSTRADPQGFDLAAARRQIEQLNERFTEAHLAGDVATIDAMFTPDARSFPPGTDAATGLPAIHALTMTYLEAGITEFRERPPTSTGTPNTSSTKAHTL